MLRKRMITTLRFIEDVDDFPIGPRIRSLVEEKAEAGSLRELRLLNREVQLFTNALSRSEHSRLEELLSREVGVDLESERAALKQKIQIILRRGTVRSEKERQHLEEYAESLRASGTDEADLQKLEELLRNT